MEGFLIVNAILSNSMYKTLVQITDIASALISDQTKYSYNFQTLFFRSYTAKQFRKMLVSMLYDSYSKEEMHRWSSKRIKYLLLKQKIHWKVNKLFADKEYASMRLLLFYEMTEQIYLFYKTINIKGLSMITVKTDNPIINFITSYYIPRFRQYGRLS